MILISDSGSTKTAWTAVSKDGGVVCEFSSDGFNPNFVSPDELTKSIVDVLPEAVQDVSEVHFYGAGIRGRHRDAVRDALRGIFPDARVSAESDMLGAARALHGHEAGFAAILGTGMNSCLFDGENIKAQVASLGFILGDEGSAGYTGKLLLRDYMRGALPEAVSAEVGGFIGMTSDEIIDRVYRQPSPNKWCGSLCRFVGDHINSHPYYESLLERSFRDFFSNVITQYPDYHKYSLGCVGSVAFAYRDILSRVASDFHVTLGSVIREPMEGLIRYHTII